jgi:hypothetical protein
LESTWPRAVIDFEVFLGKAGLVCRHREERAAFNDKSVRCANADLGVRVLSERDVWFVEVADVATRPDEWYDAAILQDLLLGHGKGVLSLPEQIKFVETNWQAIVGSFGAATAADTHSRLALLRKERAKRLFPDLYSQSGPT